MKDTVLVYCHKLSDLIIFTCVAWLSINSIIIMIRDTTGRYIPWLLLLASLSFKSLFNPPILMH